MSTIYNIFTSRKPDIGTAEIMHLTELPNIYRSIPARINKMVYGGDDIQNRESRIALMLFLFTINIIYPIFSRMFFGCLGFILSYQSYYMFGALKSGDPAPGMLKFSNGIHIHHWMYCSAGLALIWGLGIDSPFAAGLCFGGITHGIQFNDWHNFKNSNKKSE